MKLYTLSKSFVIPIYWNLPKRTIFKFMRALRSDISSFIYAFGEEILHQACFDAAVLGNQGFCFLDSLVDFRENGGDFLLFKLIFWNCYPQFFKMRRPNIYLCTSGTLTVYIV